MSIRVRTPMRKGYAPMDGSDHPPDHCQCTTRVCWIARIIRPPDHGWLGSSIRLCCVDRPSSRDSNSCVAWLVLASVSTAPMRWSAISGACASSTETGDSTMEECPAEVRASESTYRAHAYIVLRAGWRVLVGSHQRSLVSLGAGGRLSVVLWQAKLVTIGNSC